jgi:hypothetical protein
MDNNKLHRFRFHAPVDKQEKLLSPDPELMQLIESSVKPLGDLNMIQFTTSNCGKTIAQQRLIKYLINTL